MAAAKKSVSETAKTVTVLDRANKGFVTSAENLVKTMATLTDLVTSSVKVTEEIEFKESQLKAIEADMSDKERVANAQLDIRVLENENQVCAKLMSARNYAAITNAELHELRASLSNAETSNEDAIESAVKKANTSSAISANAKEATLKAVQSVETAELKAQIQALTSEVSYLKTNNSDLKEDAKSEREARVSIAASAKQVVVNSQPSR